MLKDITGIEACSKVSGALQASRFGAFLDVAADNLSRAAILTAALSGPWPAVLITLEALTFVCTNAVSLLPEVRGHMTALTPACIESCDLAFAGIQ